jgi:hypothetical protein
MSMAPEGATSPLAQAPPDRPGVQLEQWARQGIALLFGDRVLDPDEQRILRGFMEEVAMRAQAGGGIGQGGTPSPEAAPGEAPPDTSQETSDFGDGQGEPTGEEY